MGIPATLSSVPALTPYIQYVATNGQTVFPYPFPITQDSDLIVVVNGVTLNTDAGYTLSGQGNATGGNLTFALGQVSGAIVTLFRDITIQRVTQIGQNSGFSSTAFNAEYNSIYLILQQLDEALALCLQVPNTNSPAPTTGLTPGAYANKYLSFDNNGNPIPAALTSVGTLTAQIIGALVYPRTTAEINAGVTPTTNVYPQGDPRRYGAALDGATDDTGALNNWAKVGGKLTWPVGQIALISSSINLVSNSLIEFAAGGGITNATLNINMISMSALSNVTIRGGKFTSTAATSATQVGAINMASCVDCTVEDCSFSGMPFNAIWGTANTYCTIRNNYFYASAAAAIQDSADINWVSSAVAAASYNVIDGNYCYGGGEFGIACWDPYSGVLPTHNVITNNRIGPHTGYGILVYMPDAGDSYNQVIGNHIEGITGGTSWNTSSGAGIYVTGQGLGGTVVANNTIRNCCIGTKDASLAPGGIGVNGGPALIGVPMTIMGNVISDMTQYNGILVTGGTGVVISGNTVRMPATQTTIGHAIAVVNSTATVVSSNNINLLSTTQSIVGIFVEAILAGYSNVVISNNVINGGHFAQIRFVNDSQLYGHISVSGNICFGGDTSCIPLVLEAGSAVDVVVVGNTFTSQSATAISQTGCLAIRYSANFVTGTGAILLTAGTCTNSFFDRSNYGIGQGAGVTNGATGFIIELLGTAAPVAGTWAVGDTVRNSVPSAAGVYEWICTTAGAPGTWKTISNT